MLLGQLLTVIGLVLMVALGLAGTVGVVPALAGSAAAVGGLMQQLVGGLGAYAVGWFSHQGPVNLGWVMLGFTACAALAQARLRRH